MAADPPLDAFHPHEVLHTASIIAELFEERIEQHRYSQSHPEIRAAAERLSAQLHDFYQLVGRHTVATPNVRFRPIADAQQACKLCL